MGNDSWLRPLLYETAEEGVYKDGRMEGKYRWKKIVCRTPAKLLLVSCSRCCCFHSLATRSHHCRAWIDGSYLSQCPSRNSDPRRLQAHTPYVYWPCCTKMIVKSRWQLVLSGARAVLEEGIIGLPTMGADMKKKRS